MKGRSIKKQIVKNSLKLTVNLPFLLLECSGEQKVPIHVFQISQNKPYDFLFSEAQRKSQTVRIPKNYRTAATSTLIIERPRTCKS